MERGNSGSVGMHLCIIISSFWQSSSVSLIFFCLLFLFCFQVKEPQRDLPLGIGLSLASCGSLYMAIAAVLVGIMPYDQIDPDTPMAQAFATYNLTWVK